MKHFLSLVFGVIVLSSCNTNNTKDIDSKNKQDYYALKDSGIQIGGVKIISVNSPKGELKIWTKRIGNNPRIKLLLLSGGPGSSHEYFECMESFLPAEEIEFIYYDQSGTGYSDNPNDTSMWDLSRYVEEVEEVRKSLGLNQDNFYLLGHSWGGILAMQYALKYQQNLKGLIVSNMMSSAPAYSLYAKEVLAPQFPPAILDTIRQIEASKDFQNPKYMGLLMEHFYPKHILRLPPPQWPEPVVRAFSKMNTSLYVTMQGPSEFGLSGKLENWDISQQLRTIQVPVLVIGATHDTMDPKHMEWMSKEFPKGQYLFCPNGSHMSMYDDQQTYMKGIIKFMKQEG